MAMAYFVPAPGGMAFVGTLVKKAVDIVTKEIEQVAKATAPVDTGAFRNSIKSEVEFDGIIPKGTVYADIRYAVYLEYGTTDTPTFATLQKAADSVTI
jgi:hypothetical protein